MALRYPLANEDRIGQSFVHFTFLNEDDDPNASDFSAESTITLYIPQGLNFNDGVNYGTSDFGALGEAVQGLATRGEVNPLAGAGRDTDETTLSSRIRSAARQFDGQSIDAIASYALVAAGAGAASRVLGGGRVGAGVAAVASALGAASATDAIGLGTGRVFNPNTKTVFRGISVRSFTLSFPMIATSSDEARQIDEISNAFRKQMYPAKVNGGDGFSLFLKYPNKVLIQFFTSAGEDGNGDPKYTFKPCFITNVNRSINSTSPSFHRDGEPVEMTLTISFTEDSILTSEDIGGGL